MAPAPRLLRIAAALLACASLRAARAAEPAAVPEHGPEEGAIVRMRFAWPAPLRARVSYRRTRIRTGAPTSVFTARYETRVEDADEGLRIITRGTSWRGDLPFPRALEKDAIRASEKVVQRVGKDGAFAGLESVDAMRPVLARVFDDAKLPPEAAERALPLAEAAMRAEAMELWNLAVGFWTGADLRAGETYTLESDAEIPLLSGVRAANAVEFGVRRRVPCAAGERSLRCVEATLRSAPDRAAVERAAGALLVRVLPAGAEAPRGAAKDLAVESVLVLVTDPATLLPRRVVWTKAVRLGAGEKGPAAAEVVDRSEYDYRYLPPEPPRRAAQRRKAPDAESPRPYAPPHPGPLPRAERGGEGEG